MLLTLSKSPLSLESLRYAVSLTQTPFRHQCKTQNFDERVFSGNPDYLQTLSPLKEIAVIRATTLYNSNCINQIKL